MAKKRRAKKRERTPEHKKVIKLLGLMKANRRLMKYCKSDPNLYSVLGMLCLLNRRLSSDLSHALDEYLPQVKLSLPE